MSTVAAVSLFICSPKQWSVTIYVQVRSEDASREGANGGFGGAIRSAEAGENNGRNAAEGTEEGLSTLGGIEGRWHLGIVTA
jgi:hypothetical protein